MIDPSRASTVDPYRWLRNALGIAALLVLEAAWTAPWVATYFAACGKLTVGMWLGFLAVSGAVAVAIAGVIRRRVEDPARRRILGLAAIVSWLALSLAASQGMVCSAPPLTGGTRPLALFFLQVPSQAALLLAVFWSWREAVPLAAPNGLNPAAAGTRLRRALIGLAAYLLAFDPQLTPTLLATLVLTIACGLLGAALARASYLGQVRAAARLPFRGRWLLTLAGVCGLVLVVGLVVAAGLAHPSILRASGMVLAGIARVLVAALGVIARGLIALGAFLVGLLQFEAPSGAALVPAATAAPAPTPVPAAPSQAIPYLVAVGQQLELILSLLLLGLLAYFAVRGMGSMGLPAALGKGGGFEPEGSEAAEETQPQPGFPRQAWGGLRRRAAQLLGAERASTATLRGLYLRLLGLARERGRERRPSETPHELLGPLATLFPGGETDLRILTAGFEEARYGGIADTPERLQAGRQALLALTRQGERGSQQQPGDR